MQFGVGVGRMSIATSPRAEHHVAPLHTAFVHFAEMHSRKVDLKGPLITEGLEADIALHSLLPSCWADVGHPDIIPHLLAHFRRQMCQILITFLSH